MPRTQLVRQKGRLAAVDQVTKKERMPSLIQNICRNMSLMFSSRSDQGMPPMRMPSGQSLENHGSWKINVRIRTTPMRTRYLK